MEDKMDQTNKAIKNKLKTVQSEAESESLSFPVLSVREI